MLYEPTETSSEVVTAAGFLAGSSGRTREAYILDLRQFSQFRHTKATSLLNAGVPLTVIQRYLGHVTPNMTAHYAKLREHTLREAFLALEKVRADGSPSVMGASDLYQLCD